jgi:hypothetical protein
MPLIRQDSALFSLALELFLRHRPNRAGGCPRCATAEPCHVERDMDLVLRSADADPYLLTAPKRRPEATHWYEAPTSTLPVFQSSGWFA